MKHDNYIEKYNYTCTSYYTITTVWMNKFHFPAKNTSNLWNNRTVWGRSQQDKPTCRVWCGVWFLEWQGKWMAVSFAETTCGLRCAVISSGKMHVVWVPAIESQQQMKRITEDWHYNLNSCWHDDILGFPLMVSVSVSWMEPPKDSDLLYLWTET